VIVFFLDKKNKKEQERVQLANETAIKLAKERAANIAKLARETADEVIAVADKAKKAAKTAGNTTLILAEAEAAAKEAVNAKKLVEKVIMIANNMAGTKNASNADKLLYRAGNCLNGVEHCLEQAQRSERQIAQGEQALFREMKEDKAKSKVRLYKERTEEAAKEAGAEVEISDSSTTVLYKKNIPKKEMMDLNNLRELSKESQSKIDSEIASQILKKCNPQKIAQDLMRELQIKANEAAKRGERSAYAYFVIWRERRRGSFNTPLGMKYGKEEREGPLVDFPDKRKASEVLFTMVKKYIKDNNIQLNLTGINDSYENYDYNRYQDISISVKW